MRTRSSVVVAVTLFLAANSAKACEPVLPFIQTVVPTFVTGSVLVLVGAVVLKSVLFTFFEQRLPRLRAAWRMFLGNVLTSFIGVLVAAMIGSGPAWIIGVPLVGFLCWLPARRLVRAAPLRWLGRFSPLGIASMMTISLLASCILFVGSRGAIETHHLATYWSLKVVAIFFALFASVTLTTIWEEWAIWRLSSRPEGTQYFTSVLRTNLYVLILVLAVPAAIILPKRLKSPDFLARHRPTTAVDDGSARSDQNLRWH